MRAVKRKKADVEYDWQHYLNMDCWTNTRKVRPTGGLAANRLSLDTINNRQKLGKTRTSMYHLAHMGLRQSAEEGGDGCVCWSK